MGSCDAEVQNIDQRWRNMPVRRRRQGPGKEFRVVPVFDPGEDTEQRVHEVFRLIDQVIAERRRAQTAVTKSKAPRV